VAIVGGSINDSNSFLLHFNKGINTRVGPLKSMGI
jgi:hypothetical protein